MNEHVPDPRQRGLVGHSGHGAWTAPDPDPAHRVMRIPVVLDSALDPHVTLGALRDHSGRIADFRVMDANTVACAYMRLTREVLVGSLLSSRLPAAAAERMMPALARVIDSGVPLDMAGIPHPHERSKTERRYDVHAEADGSRLVIGFRDTTDIHAAASMRRANDDLSEAQEQFHLAMDISLIGMCLVSTDGHFLRVNHALCEMLGRSEAELLSLTWQQLTHAEDLVADLALADEMLTGQRMTYRLLKRYIAADGHLIWGELSVAAVHNDEGQVRYFVSQIVDVTEHRATQHALAERERLLSAVLDSSSDIVIQFDRDLRIQYVNRRAVDVSGIPLDDWIDRELHDLGYNELDLANGLERLNAVFESGQPGTFEYAVASADGTAWFEAKLAPELAEDGTVAHVIATSRDVTDRRIAQADLLILATHDPLTGLANRTAIVEEINRCLASSTRSGAPTGILMIDLDRFKIVNDSLGHAVGDALISAAARRLEAIVRQGDLVGRAGGDEFVVVMRDVHVARDAYQTAARIVEAFREPFHVLGSELFSTVSVGIALGVAGSSAVDLLREADTAMYVAKDEGRDRIMAFNDDLRAVVTTRLALEGDLRHALHRGELAVWYQPEVDLTTGSVLAAEALLRWRHPDGAIRAADSFIGVAEDTGLILDIGDWTLGRLCRDVALWPTMRRPACTVRFNLSALQLAEGGLLPALDEAIASAGVDPALLCAEITETALLRKTATVSDNLTGLRERGLQLALDDFGTGYASLAYLRDYPITVVKIDRSFIAKITQDDHCRRLVAGIVSLADALEMTVTAEGVETMEQADCLRELGCPRGQGFLFSPAVPPAEFERLFMSGGSSRSPG